MASQIDVVQTLIKAVETVMNPLATNEERQCSQKICEDFKENAKGCIGCGLELASQNNSPFVRHFGLQVVEHCIKYRWNEIGEAERAVLKQNTLLFIDQSTRDLLEEDQHIKDGVCRVLVELIKREWPQLWCNLFGEFTVLCEKGAKQTEIILQTMLRLSEDVIRFDNLPPNRRSDVQQALNAEMGNIFSFFNFILTKNLDIYKTQTGLESLKACRICQATLDTLGGFVDWAAVKHIMASDLLCVLCSLLLDKDLCLKASECLLIIVGRKGKLQDRKPLLILFEHQPMTVLLQAASHAAAHITESTNFIFLKRLCEILLELGKQLCMLWGSAEKTEQPSNFKMYLDACVVFTQHPSQSLQQMIFSVWLILLRHPLASKDPVFESILPTLVKCCTVCLYKVGYPSQSNSISCEYSRLEFDSDEEFGTMLTSLRNSVMESIRLMTLMAPKLTFMAASSWLQEELRKPIITQGTHADVDKGICNLSSPSYMSWDACSVFLEDVMSKLFQAEGEKPDVKEGIDLLHSVLAYENQDPLILSAILSCVSGLFPFLTYTPETLPKVLAKIFNAVVFHLPGQTKSTRSQSVKNVRVHACSVVVKICKHYPELLLPEFDHLYSCVKQLDSDKEQLSQMEKTILVEALIIVSNQFHNFNQQSSFLEEVIHPVKQLWTSPDFTRAFTSPECFMSYVGLDQAAVEPSSADTCGINRSHITYCINTILAVIKRSQCPADFALAQKGGFVVAGEGGGCVMRNPASPHIVPLLENLLILLRTYKCLWLPQYVSLRHQDFVKAYDLMEHECLMMQGITPSYQDNTDSLVHRRPLERMQNFISGVFDNGLHILGNASQYLGLEFYTVAPLVKSIRDTLAHNLTLLPEHRIKSLIRNFVKQHMQFCPKPMYKNVCIPFLCALCPEVFERLKAKWLIVSQRVNEGNDEDDHQESQEVIEDLVLRNITKEYLELLTIVLSGKSGAASEVKEEEAMEDGGDGPGKVAGGGGGPNNVFRELNELGAIVAGTQELYPSIIMFLLTGLSWPDTWACYRCAVLLWPVCRQLDSNSQMSTEAHQHVFMSILSGLQLNGMDTACQSILITMALSYYETFVCTMALSYHETFHKQYPVISLVLGKIPNVPTKLIMDLDEKLASPMKAGLEKKKKQIFKKIIENIIGKNIGERFRRTAQYTNLPRLFLETRRRGRMVAAAALMDGGEGEEDNLGLCELFES